MEYLDFEIVVSDYYKASNLPTYVSGMRFSANHIFDEDKSVKWNREEVVRQNELRRQQEIVLRETKNKALRDAEANIISYLKQEYPRVSETKIKKLFDHIKCSIEYSIEGTLSVCEEILEIFSEEDD